jgi:hypothetical protein
MRALIVMLLLGCGSAPYFGGDCAPGDRYACAADGGTLACIEAQWHLSPRCLNAPCSVDAAGNALCP